MTDVTPKSGAEERPGGADDQKRSSEPDDVDPGLDPAPASDANVARPVGDHEPETAAVLEPASRSAPDAIEPPTPRVRIRRRLTAEEAEAQRKRRAKRRRRRVAGLVLMSLGVAILISGGWVAWRTYQAYSHLQAASDQVSELQKDISEANSLDFKATDTTVARLQGESANAKSAVADPFFRAASKLPWIGPNLHAISEVAGTVHSLSTDVVPSLVQIAQTLRPSALAPKNGVIDLTRIEAASPLLQNADAAVNASRTRLAAIDRAAVVQQVNSAVLKLWSKLDQASSITSAGARVARLLPPMLGAGGRRTYLVVFQNLAEARATGGIFGSFAVVRVDDGKVSIVDQGATRTLQMFDPPIAQLDSKTTKLYSDLMAIFPADVNLTPDFPTAASLFAKMYTKRKGTPIDGVIATDPVALSYALKGVRPIDVGDGFTLTAKTVIPILLSTVYSRFRADADQSDRDAFLSRATTLAFSEIVSGTGDAGVIVSGLKQAVGERRVLIWSANPGEQADIAQTGIAGRLSTTPDDPTVGVFLNDGTGAKLDYYLASSVNVTAGKCRADGRRQLHVALTFRYNAPLSGLPSYVRGNSEVRGPYVLRTNVLVFAPVGGGIVGATQGGAPIGVQRGEDRSREVGQVTIVLIPGASTSLEVIVLAPVSSSLSGGVVTPALVLTPGVQPWKMAIASYPSCNYGG